MDLPRLPPSEAVGEASGAALFLLAVAILAWPLVQRIATARRQRQPTRPEQP